jgi:hypothetical protein
LGNSGVYSSIAFAISIDEAFVTVVVVLNATTSWTLEDNMGLALNSLKFATVDVLSFYLEPF